MDTRFPSLQFDDGKADDALRTIGEVAKALGLKQHVLRYWEQQFPMLEPLKRSGGRRYYRPADIRLVQAIDAMVNGQGFTIKGAKQALEKGEMPAMQSEAAGAVSPSAAADILPQLRQIRARLATALAQ
ncbi:MerR family transcriptional regulator [Altericroceibacterium spongiae]|uniref:MerR family transcriptional regulator n=1 Tax=Altericroceibacterium spongiae TaxID=2320269 RepID=A0A420EKD8_9SPHN|nr:MerR family transcriptional regulator [Altericroceibacterium spongiae]RKF21147.1 MerR family transcriptional regulator [Altericroceibacterium spongiae]